LSSETVNFKGLNKDCQHIILTIESKVSGNEYLEALFIELNKGVKR